MLAAYIYFFVFHWFNLPFSPGGLMLYVQGADSGVTMFWWSALILWHSDQIGLRKKDKGKENRGGKREKTNRGNRHHRGWLPWGEKQWRGNGFLHPLLDSTLSACFPRSLPATWFIMLIYTVFASCTPTPYRIHTLVNVHAHTQAHSKVVLVP